MVNMYIDFNGEKLWLEDGKAYDIDKLTKDLASLKEERKALANLINHNSSEIARLSSENLVKEVRLNEVDDLIKKISGVLDRMDKANK